MSSTILHTNTHGTHAVWLNVEAEIVIVRVNDGDDGKDDNVDGVIGKYLSGCAVFRGSEFFFHLPSQSVSISIKYDI